MADAAAYVIRPATLDDLPALVGIERASFGEADYAGMIMDARNFRAHVGKANILLVLVPKEKGEQPVGYALGFVKRGSPYVRFYSLAVRPEHRGAGAGSLLFRAMEAAARERGYRGMRLEVRESNQHLVDRYGRYGYAPFVRVPDYYPDGTAATSGEDRFSNLAPSPDLAAYCIASGGHGATVHRRSELEGAIKEALRVVRDEKRQAVLDIRCK